MKEVFVRQLKKATGEDLKKGTAILVAAFDTPPDEFGLSLVQGDLRLSSLLHRAHLTAGVVGGEVWVAGFDEHDISAVAIWFGPGQDFLSTEEQRQAGFNDIYKQFPPELQRWWTEYYFPRYNELKDSTLGKGTKLNSWQLQLLATKPECEGKGLATALIRVIQDRANKENVGMCLETTTDENITFYKKRGFVLRGAVQIVGSHGETTLSSLYKAPEHMEGK